MKSGGLLLGLAASLLGAGPALAADSAVRLELDGCSELSESALREHLAIELSTLGLDPRATHLGLHCQQGAVDIELYRADGSVYPIASRVELRETARGSRERLVALAASELRAQAAREERAPVRPPVVVAPAPAPQRDQPTALRERRPTERRRVELSLAGSAASSGSPKAWLWGGVLGVRFGLGRRGSVVVDTQLQRGSERVPFADVRWTVLGGFAGGALDGELGPLRLSAGLGIRAGWLTWAADADAPNGGQSFTAPWAGPALPLRVALAAGAVSPFIAGEVGYVTLPVRGRASDGRLLMEQRGAWWGGSLGLAVEL